MNNEATVRYTTIGLVLAGFGAIFLAWNGAAGEDHVPAQLPYLISGGLAGVVLSAAGLTLLRNFEARRDSLRVEARLDSLREAVDRLATAQGTQSTPAQPMVPWYPAWGPPGPGHPAADPGGAHAQGAPPTMPMTAPQFSPDDHGAVVAGPSTYHREDCHLIAKRQAPSTSRAAARQRGLSPCRVCNPDRPRDEGNVSDGQGSHEDSSEQEHAAWEPVR